MSQIISHADVKELAERWFTLLMKHDSVDKFLPLFAFDDPDFHMKLSTMEISNFDDFQIWYKQYTYTFFDSAHSLSEILSISVLRGNDTNVKAVEHWEGSMWQPPNPNSARMIVDATHTWTIIRSKATDQPVFKTYIPTDFKFAEGSALPPTPKSSANT